MKRVAITGAAGNLGGILALRLAECGGVELNLLYHKKEIAPELARRTNVTIHKIDLADRDTLCDSLEGVDTVVHFAGVLFKANPEKFLPVTNTQYFANLLDVCIAKSVRRVILISFPHVEGSTSPEHPATGILDGVPDSCHARTRLEEEKLLFKYGSEYGFEAVSLRVGMVYGKGILMIDAAQWFARYGLLGIWRKPTYIHLISKDDFAGAVSAAVFNEGVEGIYHIGDEGVQTLQHFLDDITTYKGNLKPWRMPVWMIMSAARFFELWSAVFGVRAPLTVDFIRIGRVSYYGDTTRMRRELLPALKYKTYKEGLELF